MNIQQKLSVTTQGRDTTETREYVIGFGEYVRLEELTGKSVIEHTPTMSDISRMAYFAAKKAGHAGDDFYAWLDAVVDIEFVNEAPKA